MGATKGKVDINKIFAREVERYEDDLVSDEGKFLLYAQTKAEAATRVNAGLPAVVPTQYQIIEECKTKEVTEVATVDNAVKAAMDLKPMDYAKLLAKVAAQRGERKRPEILMEDDFNWLDGSGEGHKVAVARDSDLQMIF